MVCNLVKDLLVLDHLLLVLCRDLMVHHLIFHPLISLTLDRHKPDLVDSLDLMDNLVNQVHLLLTFQTSFSVQLLRNLDLVDNLDLADNLALVHLADLPANLDLAANLDLIYHLHQDHLLQILDHEDFSLMHLLLQLDLIVLVELGLVDNLDLVDPMEYLMQGNLDNHKVHYPHRQQVMRLQVDFSHYL